MALRLGSGPITREIRIRTATFAEIDSRLSFGHVTEPGEYSTTITRPSLFEKYLTQQLELLMKNHGVPVSVGSSATPIPIHFAVDDDSSAKFPDGEFNLSLRDMFDVPDLATLNDDIANGMHPVNSDGSRPLSLFPAQRNRLLACKTASLHGDEPCPFPESCAFHQLPILHRRIQRLRPDCARRPELRLLFFGRARRSRNICRRRYLWG